MTRLLAALAMTLAFIGTARADDIPLVARGTWVESRADPSAACRRPTMAVHVTARSIVIMRPVGEQRLWRLRTLRTLQDWLIGEGGGLDRPRLLLRPTINGTSLDFAVADPKSLDSDLPGQPQVTHLIPCSTLPVEMTAVHGEGIAFLQGLEAMEPACGGGDAQACAVAVLAYADVGHVGRLTPAAIARAVRGLTWATQMAAGTTQADLVSGIAASALSGILIGQFIVQSFDYEGRGSVTVNAIILDRFGLPGVMGDRSASVTPLALERLADQSASLRALVSQVPLLFR